MKEIAVASLLLFGFSGSVSACNTLGEQLAQDEPIVKAALSALEPGEQLAGISLCDKSIVFEGWRYIRRAKAQGPLQHVLLFKDGHSMRAVAWVESRGKGIAVPACPLGPRCDSLPEGAAVISGDAYTFSTIKPRGEVVILRYPPASW